MMAEEVDQRQVIVRIPSFLPPRFQMMNVQFFAIEKRDAAQSADAVLLVGQPLYSGWVGVGFRPLPPRPVRPETRVIR